MALVRPDPAPPRNTDDDIFRTDHLRDSLRHRSISGGVITLSAQAIKLAITIVSTAILARLLLPRDFGLVAMITALTGLLASIKDAGLSMATIQAENISHAQVSNLFWLNVALCSGLALVTAGCAPLLSWFYRTPGLTPLTLALSATFVLDGLAVQHTAILCRQMRFDLTVRIEIVSMLCGQGVGIALAAAGARSWALVASIVTMSLCALIMSWSLCRWRPQLPRAKAGTKGLVHFGANLTAASCLSYFSRSVDNFLIGRFYGAQTVGLYSRAAVLLRRPLDQLMGPLTTVVQPMLARMQGDPERYRRAFLQVYWAIALVGLPFTGLVLALRHPLVLLLLGPRWDAAAAIFGAFTLATLYSPLAYAAFWLFESQGRGRDMLVASLIIVPITIASIAAGLPWGAFGVAASFSLTGIFIRLPILFHIASRSGPVRSKDLWSAFGLNLHSWVAVFGFTTWLLHRLGGHAPAVQLLICVPAGIALAAGLALCFPPQRRVVFRLGAIFRTLLARGAPA